MTETRFEGVLAIFLLLSFLTVNVALNIFNKYIFSGPLPIPVFVTMTHQIACFLYAFSCMAFPSFYKRSRINSSAMLCKLLIIPFGFVLSIGLNNISLMFTTLALNQLIRSLSPVTVAFTAFFIEGTRYSFAEILTLMLLTFGLSLGVATSTDFDTYGVVICLASVLGSTFQLVLTGFFLSGEEIRLQVLDILLYTAIPSSIILAPMSVGMGEMQTLTEAVEKVGLGTVVILISVGCAMAVLYNLIQIILIKYTSSVYFSVAGGFKTGVTIGMSYIFFKQAADIFSLVGIAITSIAFAIHSYLSYKKRLPTNKTKPVKEVSTSDEEQDLLLGKPSFIGGQDIPSPDLEEDMLRAKARSKRISRTC
ncbi:hypothetical protein AAMO2058_001027200 [Amorphochlora amoebiformis]